MSQQPNPPVISPDIHRALVDVAMEFRRLEPWKSIPDCPLIGLQDTPEGTIRLVSILGSAKQVYGLIIYRRKTGIRWILETLSSDEDLGVQNLNFLMSQDCLKIEFAPKSELETYEISALNQIRFKPAARSKNAWPRFHSFVPGTLPWYLDQEEAIQLTADLHRILSVIRLELENPFFESHTAEEVPFVQVQSSSSPLRPEDISWQRLSLPPEPLPKAIAIPESDRQSLLKLPQNKMAWEVDCLYAPESVLANPRPVFPWFFLAVDTNTQMILRGHMDDSQTLTCEAVAADQLLKTIRQLKTRPSEIHLSNPKMTAALSGIATALDIQLFDLPSLPTLHALYKQMKDSMGMRR